jgi:hypothetical protein
MNKRKLIISTLSTVLLILVVHFFWEYPLIVALLLIGVALIKGMLAPFKKQFLMYIIFVVAGAGAESAMMYGGGWVYENVALFNFPIWLPFLWGATGIVSITFYQGIVGDK